MSTTRESCSQRKNFFDVKLSNDKVTEDYRKCEPNAKNYRF